MYNGLLHLHNLLRWVILVLLLISVIQAFRKNSGLQKTSLWLLIAAHITLLLGIFQWFNGKLGWHLIQDNGFGNVIKDAVQRFWVVEHMAGMIISVILITIARGKSRKAHYKAASWLYFIALIIILASVPWPFREGIGRPWFPGMGV